MRFFPLLFVCWIRLLAFSQYAEICRAIDAGRKTAASIRTALLFYVIIKNIGINDVYKSPKTPQPNPFVYYRLCLTTVDMLYSLGFDISLLRALSFEL